MYMYVGTLATCRQVIPGSIPLRYRAFSCCWLLLFPSSIYSTDLPTAVTLSTSSPPLHHHSHRFLTDHPYYIILFLCLKLYYPDRQPCTTWVQREYEKPHYVSSIVQYAVTRRRNEQRDSTRNQQLHKTDSCSLRCLLL